LSLLTNVLNIFLLKNVIFGFFSRVPMSQRKKEKKQHTPSFFLYLGK
jgi:hypothetical protein